MTPCRPSGGSPPRRGSFGNVDCSSRLSICRPALCEGQPGGCRYQSAGGFFKTPPSKGESRPTASGWRAAGGHDPALLHRNHALDHRRLSTLHTNHNPPLLIPRDILRIEPRPTILFLPRENFVLPGSNLRKRKLSRGAGPCRSIRRPLVATRHIRNQHNRHTALA